MPKSVERIEDVEGLLAESGYVGDREIATAIFLAIRLHRPILVEGYAGVGKTEIAKTLARALGATLYRLQCYEGLDVSSALYEWNYAKQILRIRMEERSIQSAAEKEATIFSEPYLLTRPILQALMHASENPVLLIDEVDRADEEFEAFLLEMLSEYQVSIPELGVIRAERPPHVVLTSNRVRELGRRAEAPLSLSVDRVSDSSEGNADRPDEDSGDRRFAGAADLPLRGIAADDGSRQTARCRGDARLGNGVDRAASGTPFAGSRPVDARLRAQVLP